MQKISLKEWVILLTLLPTTVIGLCLAGYFSYVRNSELDSFLEQRALSIVEPLAIASQAPLEHRRRQELHQLISFVHRSHALIIKTIAVFTEDNQLYSNTAYHGDTNLLRIKAGEEIPDLTSVTDHGSFLIFRTPIVKEISPDLDINSGQRQNNIGYIAIQVDKDKVKLQQQNQIIAAFSIVLLCLLLTAFFTFKLIRTVTRPISAMVHAIDRIREGKLESRVSGQLLGELNFLKNGINAMAQSLGDYQDEMQRSVDQATLDLRESLEQFEIQNVELDLAKRKAQEANRVKSEFLANMSHELRTPLNGVIGFTRQVLKTPLTDTQRDYLQTIDRSANNLLSIINDILDFSKLDAGRLVVELIPFPIRETMEETLTLLAPTAHSKNIELSMRISPQLPDTLIGDAMRIQQILINLTGNAIKFTEQGSVTIDVECERIENNIAAIKVSVNDTGIGIEQAKQDSLFEAFGQADKSITRLYGGTGLGLIISKRLASEMSGTVGFSSIEGKGSTFWFTFQCQLNSIPLSTPLDTEALINKEVLYFEPHRHSQETVADILASWSMKVTTVRTMDACREALKNNKHYDFALLASDASPNDINDVKHLITEVKVNIPSVHIAVNSNSPNLHEAFIAAGAQTCSSKPLTPQKLCRALSPNAHNNLLLAKSSPKSIKLPIKVLAVDDNEANLKLISALLLEQVSEVIVANNGEEAVRFCNEENFALIFMDIQMPVMDGVTACKIIKQSMLNSATPIIAVTAHALSGEKEKLLQEGFDSYLTKPIDETMLRHTIFEYCDTQLLSMPKLTLEQLSNTEQKSLPVIDWDLAIKRAGHKEDLAQEMLQMLIDSLPITQHQLGSAIKENNVLAAQKVIHKLNGACCYNGVPSLERLTKQIETSLKQQVSLINLEPEFFEFNDEIEKLIAMSSQYLTSNQTKLVD